MRRRLVKIHLPVVKGGHEAAVGEESERVARRPYPGRRGHVLHRIIARMRVRGGGSPRRRGPKEREQRPGDRHAAPPRPAPVSFAPRHPATPSPPTPPPP